MNGWSSRPSRAALILLLLKSLWQVNQPWHYSGGLYTCTYLGNMSKGTVIPYLDLQHVQVLELNTHTFRAGSKGDISDCYIFLSSEI